MRAGAARAAAPRLPLLKQARVMSPLRRVWTVAALLAACSFLLFAIWRVRSGEGLAALLVACMLLTALWLRFRHFRP